ncbi:MAG: hypothetical protein MJ108_07210 [Saccharofermentans sp.]|nr:hypothetical protein [Saccharofermentans sp.]
MTILSTLMAGALLCSCSSNTPSDVTSESEAAQAALAEETVVGESVGVKSGSAESNDTLPHNTEAGVEVASVPAVANEGKNVTMVSSLLDVDEIKSSGDRWYRVESESVANGTYGFFRLEDTFMPDKDGNVYVLSYSGDDYNDYELNSYNVIDNTMNWNKDFDESEVAAGDEYSTDGISFVVNGQPYVELDRYTYSSDDDYTVDIESKIYSVQGDAELIEMATGFLGHNEAIISAFATNRGTCIATMEFEDFLGRNCKLKFCSDSINPDLVVNLDEMVDDGINYVYSVANMDNGDYIVEYMDSDYCIHYVILSQDGVSCEEAPSYFYDASGIVQIFNYADQLFIFDDTGLYIIIDDEAIPVYTVGYSYNGLIGSIYSYPLIVEDDRIVFITTNYDGDIDLTVDTLYLSDCPYEDRTKLTVGVLRYYSDIVLEQLEYFNSTNDEYYAVPMLINDNGIYPLISAQNVQTRASLIKEAIPYEDNEYVNDIALECAFNMELKEFLSGPDAPDVLATDGMWGQLINSDVMADLSPVYDDLSGNEYYSNILEASRLSGSYFIPVYYSLGGVIDYDADDAANTDNFALTYSDYQNFVNNNWAGVDPVCNACEPFQYAEELMSYQYDLYVDRENHKVTLTDNDYFNQLMLYIAYAVEPAYGVRSDADYSDAEYGQIFEVSYFLSTVTSNDEVAIYSLPSADGRSIGADPTLCLGIAKNSGNSEGARAFVKSALSCEAQLLSETYFCGLPVNRNALSAMASDYRIEDIQRLNHCIESVNTIYIADAELRYACYGPIMSLINGDYNNSDYAPEQAGHDIETNMEYFLKED